MRNRFVTGPAAALALVAAVAATGRIAAQTSKNVAKTAAKPAGPYSPPRLADEHPDLQGTYDLATLTPVERPAGTPLVRADGDPRQTLRHLVGHHRGQVLRLAQPLRQSQ